jgi:hypothetical protein
MARLLPHTQYYGTPRPNLEDAAASFLGRVRGFGSYAYALESFRVRPLLPEGPSTTLDSGETNLSEPFGHGLLFVLIHFAALPDGARVRNFELHDHGRAALILRGYFHRVRAKHSLQRAFGERGGRFVR